MRQTIDGAAFRRMIISAAAAIEINKQKINELNVFPVPDGDTGTNMSMTINNAVADLKRADSPTLTKAADITASALLRGARGNSGVILSLLFRGISKSLKGVEETTGVGFAEALQVGVDSAYKAVMKPAEGTILTVARLAAAAAEEATTWNTCLTAPSFAARSLWRTPSIRTPYSKRRALWTQAAWAGSRFFPPCSPPYAART